MPDPLEALAARAAEEPFFLAWLLSAYAFSEGLDDAALAAAARLPRAGDSHASALPRAAHLTPRSSGTMSPASPSASVWTRTGWRQR